MSNPRYKIHKYIFWKLQVFRCLKLFLYLDLQTSLSHIIIMEKKHKADSSNGQTETNKKNKLRLLEMIASPWELIKKGGKLGIKGAGRFFLLMFLFGAVNSALIVIALIKLFLNEINRNNIIGVVLVVLVAAGSIAYAGYRAYRNILIDTIRVVYESLAPFFQKMCRIIIDKTEKLFSNNKKPNKNVLTKTIDFSKLVYENFQKVPRFLRSVIVFMLQRIPLMDILMGLQSDIKAGRKENASQNLFLQMDSFIQNTFFGTNTQWVLWLLPLNIVVSLILIILMIG